MAKYLDKDGLETVWGAVKQHDADTLTASKNYADGLNTTMGGRVSTLEGYFIDGKANEAIKATKDGNNNVIDTTYVKLAQLGVASTTGTGAITGVATLGTDGKVPSTQLPSFVDDVIEGYYYQNKFYSDSAHTTEITGEAGKIYVDLSTGKTYRWGGTAYAEISSSLAIGTTQGTAFDGASGAQLQSDVSALQTAVNTTIPATYVPITAGNYTITNSSSKIELNRAISSTRKANISINSGTPDSIRLGFFSVSGSSSALENGISIRDDNGNNAGSVAIQSTGDVTIYASGSFKLGTKIVATTDDITITDMQVNGTSVVSSKVANIVTNTAYNASTNKIATMSDVPSVEAISSTELANILV